jgi:hypothetical protein
MTPTTEDKSDQRWLEVTRPVVDSWVKPTMTAPLSPLTVFRRRYGPGRTGQLLISGWRCGLVAAAGPPRVGRFVAVRCSLSRRRGS